MELHITLDKRGQLAADVYRQLHAAIVDGRLRAGDQLPATRLLAERLEVSRNTVLDAYQRLVAEGFLVGRAGAGTFVSADAASRVQASRTLAAGGVEPRPAWRAVARASTPSLLPATYDFRIGIPDPSLFPWDDWRRAVSHHLRRRRRAPAPYPASDGAPRLRAAIARSVAVSRGVRASADTVVVTSGAQQAFDLIARVLVEPGAMVAVEEPGYLPARAAFRAAGARVVPVPVDGEGLVVDALPKHARVVYVTPSHQFPLGHVMSLRRRQALLAFCATRGAAIVEDDYDSEFRFDGRPLETLQSLDSSGHVIYVGSYSKVLSPTLRLGFIAAPPSLLPALRAAKRVADSHGAIEMQLALAEVIDDGLLARHVRRMQRVYRERRDLLVAALERQLGDAVEILSASAGLHISALFVRKRTNTATIVAAARAADVAVEALAPYYLGRSRAGLALGYGLIPAGKIDDGVRRLAAAVRAHR